ncbi:MAG TPA: alpha/beta hydrolase [Thermomicrobiales bacterium]|nr:alpha/beta hydrolase [Thermomicrobiales bacterium]
MSQETSSEIIPVWPDQMPDADLWAGIGPELERPLWENSRLVRNVSRPTLTVFLPEPSLANGAGVVVCPGGGFQGLMMDKEGTEVARWLNACGIAAFVLKYRVEPTPDDDAAYLRLAASSPSQRPNMDRVRAAAIADGSQALRTIRRQASRWTIDPDRLGIMGFSAGGAVAAGVAAEYDADSRPSFAAPIYAPWRARPAPADAPPLFLATAGDDALVDPQNSLALYVAWRAANRPAELHIYAKGGHGFALWPQGLPVDGWIDRFREWLRSEGFVP